MSKPPDNYIMLSQTLTLCEYKTGGNLGFWLYDVTRGMNLSIRAKSKTDAFIEALEYYQKRVAQVETTIKETTEKIDSFITSLGREE